MFKLALILSTTPAVNLFRATLEACFGSNYLNEFLICSGFFHERTTRRGRFFASDAIQSYVLPKKSSVTVVGSYDPASTDFNNFVQTLKQNLKDITGASVPVNQRRAIRAYANRWHAKIFIARELSACRIAVVGSSNLTRSAFDARVSNNEADVVIWDDADKKTRRLMNLILEKGKARGGSGRPMVIIANYDEKDRRNSSKRGLDARLNRLWKDVESATQ